MKWWLSLKGRSEFKYAYLFLIAIALTRGLAAYLKSHNGNFPSEELDNTFVTNFIEWFGVLYGILLPLIMVRVWEQLDDIDREFDREADTIRILYEDLLLLRGENKKIGRDVSNLLRDYIRNVIRKYHLEVKGFEKERRIGDDILIKIRKRISILIDPNIMEAKDAGFLIPEIIRRLNEVIDIRGDRIGFASQRLFQTLRLVALIASVVFIVPFYIVAFSTPLNFLDGVLILGLTLLVVFIYMIIEDFDEPFGGTWKIDNESWLRIRRDMIIEERQYRLQTRIAEKEKLQNEVEDVPKTQVTKKPVARKTTSKKTTTKKPAAKKTTSKKPATKKTATKKTTSKKPTL